MDETLSLDRKKLNRWLNVRKITLEKINTDLQQLVNHKIDLSNTSDLSERTINLIANYLKVNPEKILKEKKIPPFIFKTKKEILKSGRKIIKDKIHFYNYYTLPTPHGYVAPVLLDILCYLN